MLCELVQLCQPLYALTHPQTIRQIHRQLYSTSTLKLAKTEVFAKEIESFWEDDRAGNGAPE